MSTGLKDGQHIQLALESIGMRQRGTAVGLLQLCKELFDAGVLDPDAVVRIREAIVADVALNCPRTVQVSEYQDMVRERLNALLTDPASLTVAEATASVARH